MRSHKTFVSVLLKTRLRAAVSLHLQKLIFGFFQNLFSSLNPEMLPLLDHEDVEKIRDEADFRED